MMKTVLVTGSDGMLGKDIVSHLCKKNYRVIPSTIQSMNIVDDNQVAKTLSSHHPDVVIHAAAYTAVDKAETEKGKCMAVNFKGTENIARHCEKVGSDLIYISTDYVFDGFKEMPYVESDIPHPINVYGQSKFLGEEAVKKYAGRYMICRTSWLQGLHGIFGMSFIEKIFRLARSEKELKVIHDQRARPTFCFDFAVILELLMAKEESGIFHITNSGDCSWFELAKTALEFDQQKDVKLIPVSSEEFKFPAKRPRNSLLDAPRLKNLGIPHPRHWKEALKEFIATRKNMPREKH